MNSRVGICRCELLSVMLGLALLAAISVSTEAHAESKADSAMATVELGAESPEALLDRLAATGPMDHRKGQVNVAERVACMVPEERAFVATDVFLELGRQINHAEAWLRLVNGVNTAGRKATSAEQKREARAKAHVAEVTRIASKHGLRKPDGVWKDVISMARELSGNVENPLELALETQKLIQTLFEESGAGASGRSWVAEAKVTEVTGNQATGLIADAVVTMARTDGRWFAKSIVGDRENEIDLAVKALDLVTSARDAFDAGTLVPETHLQPLLAALAAARYPLETDTLLKAISELGNSGGIAPPAVKAYLLERAPPVLLRIGGDARVFALTRKSALVVLTDLGAPDEILRKAVEITASDRSPTEKERAFMANCGKEILDYMVNRRALAAAQAAARRSIAAEVDPQKRKAALALLRARNVEPNIDSLHYEASGLHFDTVEALLDAGVDVDARNADGKTALSGSVLTCKRKPDEALRIIRLLVGRGADVGSAYDKWGDTYLQSAVKTCDHTIVAGLLDLGADPNPAPNKTGDTPLTMAIRFDKPDVAELLVDRGARLSKDARFLEPKDERMQRVVKRARAE